MKKYLAVISIIILMTNLPLIVLAQEEAPKTVGEAKNLGTGILERLPGTIKDIFYNQALPLWRKMWVWTEPKIQILWEKLWGFTGEKTPDVKVEFQKEKEEMQNDLWERFKALF